MSETLALIIQLVFFVLAVCGTAACAIVYWLSDGEHGGIIGFLAGMVGLSIGTDLYHASQTVLK